MLGTVSQTMLYYLKQLTLLNHDLINFGNIRLRQQLSDCVADVTQWCSSRRLQLNADKTDAIWIGSRAAINKLSSQDRSLTVGGYYDQSLRRRA